MKRLLLVFIAGMLFNSCSNKNESANDNVNTVAENTLADDAKVDDTIEPGVFIQDNNIYFTFENGTIKQLTFNKTDESPILLPDNENVFFVRNVDMVSYVRKNLMIVNLDDLKERAIQDKKPEKDGL